MLWELFIVFLKIGFLSFGGGYAVIPLVQFEAINKGWMSSTQFQEIVTISGSAPGPIATNSATLIGYHTAGLPGAIIATAGIVLPSLIVVIILASFLFRNNESSWLKASFYGLRPVVTGLIIYAGLHFGFLGSEEPFFAWATVGTIILCAAGFIAVSKYKLHPLLVIIASAGVGMIIF